MNERPPADTSPLLDPLAAAAAGMAPVERLGPRVWAAGVLLVLTALTTLALMLQEFTSRSYLYLAFYAVPSNAAISVFPHEPVVLYFGRLGNLWLTALAATAGTIVAGWLDHTVFVPVLNLRSLQGYKKAGWYRKAVGYFLRYPFPTLVVAGFLPIPFFPFKFLTFSVRYPLFRYLTAVTVARFPRYLLLAWLGAVLEIPLWILIAVFVVVLLVYGFKVVPEAVRRVRARARHREPVRER